MRADVIRAVENYLTGLAARDVAGAPFHPEVVFEGPGGPAIRGADRLRAALAGLYPRINAVHITRHVVDGEYCATVFELDLTFGVIPVMDLYHVVEGQIVSIRTYYDPRKVIEGMAAGS